MAVLRPAGDFDRTYQQDMSVIRKPWQWGLLLLVILALYAMPFWGSTYLIITANEIIIAVIALQGLNILTGYTGQISLGQASFMLVGGYISGIMMAQYNLPIYITLPLAALGTGVFGLIFGLPSLRVKGFYLAMATLAAQFIIPWLTRHTFPDLLGGTTGAIEVPIVRLFGVELANAEQYLYLSLTVVIITTVLTLNVTRTRLGRAFVSIRDNDLAAELLGINPFGYKLRAFILAAMLAGIAGALNAHSQRTVGTELGYNLQESIIFLGMLVIGGLGTNVGPFFGAGSVILLEDLADLFGRQMADVLPEFSAVFLTTTRPIVFGLVLMIFLIYEPRGLAYRWQLFKAAWRLRPFSR